MANPCATFGSFGTAPIAVLPFFVHFCDASLVWLAATVLVSIALCCFCRSFSPLASRRPHSCFLVNTALVTIFVRSVLYLSLIPCFVLVPLCRTAASGITDYGDSDVFDDDWFGDASPDNDLHTMDKGRWAYLPVMEVSATATAVTAVA